MEVEKVHACKNDCVLFRDDNADLTECPECGVSGYKRRKVGGDDKRRNGAPHKVAWYFPVLPCLKHTFASNQEVQLLCWYNKEGHKDNDKYLRHPTDSTQWRNFNAVHGQFALDPRNIWFALSTDGINSFGNMCSSHSVSPVLLSICNLHF